MERSRLLLFFMQRDGGLFCHYCHKELDLDTVKLEHLNDNPTDNRPENIVPSCQSCNIKKIKNPQHRIVAKATLESNEQNSFEHFARDSSSESLTEKDVSQRNFDIVEQYLSEIIVSDGQILKSEFLNAAAYKCKKLTGFGSQQAVRNYVQMLTSLEGHYDEIKNEKREITIILRRNR